MRRLLVEKMDALRQWLTQRISDWAVLQQNGLITR